MRVRCYIVSRRQIKALFLNLYLVVALLSCLQATIAVVIESTRPRAIQNCFDRFATSTDVTNTVKAIIQWKCVQMFTWNLVRKPEMNISAEEAAWIDNITSFQIGSNRRTTGPLRVRKEYRMMSNQERRTFHDAVNTLKDQTVGGLSRYDFIASLQAGETIPMAYDGPNFLSFHRVMLYVFENALRQIHPNVTVPYIASTLESEFLPEEYLDSVLWSSRFLGNGDGLVVSGPFSGWNTPSGPLTRNAGLMGQPFTFDDVSNILSRNRTRGIITYSAPASHNLELQSDMNYLFYGGPAGQMSDVNSAAQDPVFFMHHAFVDHIWEQFRSRQRQLGIHPETDYPVSDAGQPSTARMRIGNLRNIDGFSDFFTDMIRYEEIPTCRRDSDCRSRFLKCSRQRGSTRCVALSKQEFVRKYDKRRATDIPGCDHQDQERSVQNTFAIDTKIDIREWAYIAVDVIHRRPEVTDNFLSYPIFNGVPLMTSDVYSPQAYIGLEKDIPTSAPPTFHRCSSSLRSYSRVFVHTVGVNYSGRYGDFLFLDRRQSLSMATTFTAVKSPEEGGVTDVLVYAHDHCGRVCKPYCLYKHAGHTGYQPCSGVIRVTSDMPRMYSRTYGEAVLDSWDFPDNGDCPDPSKGRRRVFLRFYCDGAETWPFSDIQPHISNHSLSQALMGILAETLGQGRGGASMVQQAPPPPSQSPPQHLQGHHAQGRVSMDTAANAVQGCMLGHGCVLPELCGPCVHGTRTPCLQSRTLFAFCIREHYVIRRCVRGTQFHQSTRSCRRYIPRRPG